MGDETKRVFPKASVMFVFPYKGITKMSAEDRKDLTKLVKTHCRKFKLFTPPSLVGMVSAGGVHPNNRGAKLLTDFYKKLVPVPPRPIPHNSGKQSQSTSYAAAVSHPPPQGTEMRQQQHWGSPPDPVFTDTPYRYQGQTGPPPGFTAPPPGFPRRSDHNQHQYLAWSIATSVADALNRDYNQIYPK